MQRQVLRVALPAIGEQVLSMMVSIVDTILVGHLGAYALAAVSLATEWLMFAMVLFWAIGTGATTLVARSLGGRDLETANGTVRQSIQIGVMVALVVAVAAELLAEPAMAVMGAEPDVLKEGATFLRIAALALPLSAVMFVGNACLRGAGNTRTTLMVMAVVNVVNIGVAWTAINGPFGLPRLGVAGSALGAVAGRSVGGLLVAWLLLTGRAGLKLKIERPIVNVGLVKRIARVGLPTGVEWMAWRVGMMVFARAVASLGTVVVAAHAVVWRTESLAFMPGLGFAIAATALVGQNLGAGDPQRAERMGYITFQLAAILMGSIGLLLILFPRPFLGIFTNDPEVIQTAILPLRIICAIEVLQAAAFVFAGALRGAGDTVYPMVVTLATMWIIRVPLALLLGLVLGMGLAGAWAGIALDLALRGIIYYFRFRRGGWKLIEV